MMYAYRHLPFSKIAATRSLPSRLTLSTSILCKYTNLIRSSNICKGVLSCFFLLFRVCQHPSPAKTPILLEHPTFAKGFCHVSSFLIRVCQHPSPAKTPILSEHPTFAKRFCHVFSFLLEFVNIHPLQKHQTL